MEKLFPYRNEPKLNLTVSSCAIQLPYHRIVYLESINKRIQIYTENKVYTVYTTLDALYKELDETIFMRAQRSYIVNMEHIMAFHFDHLILDNDVRIVTSRSQRTLLKQQYQAFLLRLAENPTKP